MLTAGPGSATALAAAAAADGADVVAAAGGDGTCSEVLNALVGTNARLGLIPLGTGNDLARSLGLLQVASCEIGSGTGRLEASPLGAALSNLVHGVAHPVDLGFVHGRWFINVAGCGFDAVVAERINCGFRYVRGTAAYLAATLQTLITFRPAQVRITTDGETRAMRAMLCAVANAQSYGGGMKVCPQAEMDDGLFDICIIGDAGALEFLCAFPRVFPGTHITHPKVTMLQARHVVIESDPPLPLLVDGEVIGTTPAEFTLHPRAIEIMIPKTH